jgi:hypothetical protein
MELAVNLPKEGDMIFWDIVIAFFIAAVFTSLFRWGGRIRAGWVAVSGFFFLVFLATWAGGLWAAPVGPPIYGRFVGAFILVGVLTALLLAAGGFGYAMSSATRPPPPSLERQESVQEVQSLNVFFWVSALLRIGAILAAYYYSVQ